MLSVLISMYHFKICLSSTHYSYFWRFLGALKFEGPGWVSGAFALRGLVAGGDSPPGMLSVWV
jgi:hypothetical protein